MAAKLFLVVCASALLVKTITASYPGCGCGMGSSNLRGAISGAEMAAAELAGAELAGLTAANLGGWGYSSPAYISAPFYENPAFTATNGGIFSVSMSSPVYPTGITVFSENSIDGTLEVVGSLPLLATVALDGEVPSSGIAGTSHSCGNGYVGISSESLAAAGLNNGVSTTVAGAELAGVNSGLANTAIAGVEHAGINAGYIGTTGYEAAITGAELASSINAGLAGARYAAHVPDGCGFSGIYY